MNDVLPSASAGLPQTPSKDVTDAKVFLAIIAAGIVIAVIVFVGYQVMTRGYHVDLSVVNQSAATVPTVEFRIGKQSCVFRNIAPGATLKQRVKLRYGGQMTYAAILQNGSTSTGIAASYLDADCEGYDAGVKVTNTGVVAN